MSKYKCKCGYEFESEGIKNDYVCPNCGAKVTHLLNQKN